MSMRIRGLAKSSLPTAVTSGVPVEPFFDLNGRQVMVLGSLLSGEDQTCNVLRVGGYNALPTDTLTRPANVTAYASGDEMTDTDGLILQFTVGRFVGATGVCLGMIITNSQNAAVKATGELRLYGTTSTPATDNAAFDASDTVNDTCQIVIPFSTASDGLTGTGGNCVYDVDISPKVYACGAADTKLYGRIIMKSAYTSPANSDTWKIQLRILQDG